jgi:hypothetical protein
MIFIQEDGNKNIFLTQLIKSSKARLLQEIAFKNEIQSAVLRDISIIGLKKIESAKKIFLNEKTGLHISQLDLAMIKKFGYLDNDGTNPKDNT